LNKTKVILCAYNWAGCKALSDLLGKGYDVFVYTHKNPSYINSVIDLCEKLKVNYTTDRINVSNLPYKPDLICSIFYRYIIGENVIDLVNGKIFNLHPSLLPDYKGCSSITWAMINGEKNIGYSFHYINKDIDTGNVLLQNKVKVEDWDTQVTLYHRVMFEASKYFLDVVDLVLEDALGNPQENSGEYYKRGCPFDGEINSNWNENKIERFIRAMNYPPLPYAKYNGETIYTNYDYKKIIGRKSKK